MRIKILQWNIWYKEDITKIADFILEHDPDVLCLQELIQDKKRDYDAPAVLSNLLDRKYNYFYREAATWDFKAGVTGQGNGIFSKYPIEKTSFEYIKRFKHNPENAGDEGRVYLEADLNVKGKNICVGTTHLSFSVNHEINQIRMEETDILLEKLKKHGSNFIFTGDLNAVPGSYVLKNINSLDNLVNAGPDYDEKTWPTIPFDYHGLFKADQLEYRIDYVFVTKNIEVIKSKILESKVSDHLPILAEINIGI
jgi:endonuclease/exonuclease/phosphatase family metal-dependent hydrolase